MLLMQFQNLLSRIPPKGVFYTLKYKITNDGSHISNESKEKSLHHCSSID